MGVWDERWVSRVAHQKVAMHGILEMRQRVGGSDVNRSKGVHP